MIKMIYNESEMKAFGAEVAKVLQPGDIIELIGDLGSGKTTLVKGIAAGLGIEENIQSPSYTISSQYKIREGLNLAHYDFYRLTDAGIMSHEIVDVVGKSAYITVIEWAGAVQNILPIDRLTMSIVAPDINTRRILIESHGFRSMELAKRI